jgi:luciferase family oxidoreductase group 1
VERFPEYVDNVLAMMDAAGVGLQLNGRVHELRATPAATSVPAIWLLGSSAYSARLAATKGMPYVFAHHFAGKGTAEALELYRTQFQPSPECPEPRTFLTVNVAAAETTEEAERLALPQLLAMLALRTGAPLTPQRLVEDAEAVEVPEQHRGLLGAMRSRWVIGDAAAVREQVTRLAATYDVDEVMVHPVAGAHTGGDPRRGPGREQTLRLLAG